MIAVRVVGVGKDAHKVHLGKKAQAHGLVRRCAFRGRGGEACDKASGLLAALGVDLLDKVDPLAHEVRHKVAFPVLGKNRDEVALASLAGAEDAHAHLAQGCCGKAVVHPCLGAHVLAEQIAFAANAFPVVVQPFFGIAHGLAPFLAQQGKFPVLVSHCHICSPACSEKFGLLSSLAHGCFSSL